MAGSDFWRDLTAKFLAVDSSGTLYALGNHIVGNDAPWTWQIEGGNNLTRAKFETLARRGASELQARIASDLLVVWLEALRQESPNFRCVGYGHEVQNDGSQEVGMISRVCEASAIFCMKLESEALQEESKEKQRHGSKPTQSIPENTSNMAKEMERRATLLAEYKAATNNPSNRRIYEANNSTIHKPQFYKWLKGSLPRDSATAINFERFLREKKPLVP